MLAYAIRGTVGCGGGSGGFASFINIHFDLQLPQGVGKHNKQKKAGRRISSFPIRH